MARWSLLLLIAVHSVAADWNYYDSFSGNVITEDEYLVHVADNTTFWCVNHIESCNASDPRKLDGSCNNLKYPQRGAAHSPTYRMLPAVYADASKPRLSAAGEALPEPRKVRTSLISDGRASNPNLTTLVTHMMLMVTTDSTSIQDTIDYLYWRDCCDEDTSDDDDKCISLSIPEDDPVHRFSGHRCQNLTVPYSYQLVGCPVQDETPVRIVTGLPLFDLNQLYGDNLTKSYLGRLFERGLMRYEILEDGSIWPPTLEAPNGCNANKVELNETRCHDVPGGFNALVGGNIGAIWFWRNHYHIANALADLNTCWDDEQLFYTARDINIAMFDEMVYHELFPTLIGRDNMLAAGVISKDESFRDLYDDSVMPAPSLEFMTALRWVHTIMESNLQLMQADGTVLGEIPAVNLTFRTGYLAVDNHLEYLTHSSYRQGAGAVDNLVDPDISEMGLANHQAITDVLSADVAKDRWFGFAPYVDYLGYCVNKSISSWEDLEEYFNPINLENLQKVYKDVTDIDLTAGMWLENSINGGYVPTVFACIMHDKLMHNIKADRHWYERADRPHAFTEEQLFEIRKTSTSVFLCKNGDNVSEIQPNPYIRLGDGNELQSCDSYDQIDFSAWADASCNA